MGKSSLGILFVYLLPFYSFAGLVLEDAQPQEEQAGQLPVTGNNGTPENPTQDQPTKPPRRLEQWQGHPTLEEAFLQLDSVQDARRKTNAQQFDSFLIHIKSDGISERCYLSQTKHLDPRGFPVAIQGWSNFYSGIEDRMLPYRYRVYHRNGKFLVQLAIKVVDQITEDKMHISQEACESNIFSRGDILQIKRYEYARFTECLIKTSHDNIEKYLKFWEQKAEEIWNSASPQVVFDFSISQDIAREQSDALITLQDTLDLPLGGRWHTRMPSSVVAHEIGHWLGLWDEGRASSAFDAVKDLFRGEAGMDERLSQDCNKNFLMCSAFGKPIEAYADLIVLRAFCPKWAFEDPLDDFLTGD